MKVVKCLTFVSSQSDPHTSEVRAAQQGSLKRWDVRHRDEINILGDKLCDLWKICLRYYGPRTIFEPFPAIFILNKTISMLLYLIWWAYAIIDYSISLVIFTLNFIYFHFNEFAYATVHAAKRILKVIFITQI